MSKKSNGDQAELTREEKQTTQKQNSKGNE